LVRVGGELPVSAPGTLRDERKSGGRGEAIMWDIAYANELYVELAKEFNHIPAGGNVLFMDGHTEFVRYKGKFPYTSAFVNDGIQ
jgi:prepilin-type processing-associated H-X9-DG protein